MYNLSEHVDEFGVDSFSSESYAEDQSFADQSIPTATSFEKQSDNKLQSDLEAGSAYNKTTPNLEPFVATACPSSSHAFTISFGDLNQDDEILPFSDSFGYPSTTTKKVSTTRNPIQAQDHVLAERKRREKLTQRFISLSSLLPNLKKMDKESVLETATNYIKELKDRVEEFKQLSGVKRKDEQESVLSESTVLVRIYCQKRSSLLAKALSEMQKLGFYVISSSAMPFANTSLLITLVAQMEDDFFITASELMKKLQLALV